MHLAFGVVCALIEARASGVGQVVDTAMTESFIRNNQGEIRPEIARLYALGRAATAGELASAILFLISDESSFVTGIALPVDGGYTAH